MTDDKDLKRLIRQRMAKTGESYTAARTHFRPPLTPELLRAHIEAHYGVEVRGLTELDEGVFRLDGPGWVARAFPAARRGAQAHEDARLLLALAALGFPAERCAHSEPVSLLNGQAVLVTEYVHGVNARMETDDATLRALGEAVGRLSTLPIASDRVAGAWHHITPNGGALRDDVEAMLRQMPAGTARDRLEAVDDLAGLPTGFIHVDPSGANAILPPQGGPPVLVDWAGAGNGPRVLPLASVISAALRPRPLAPASRDLTRVDAVVAGYRRHAEPTPEELLRLGAAMSGPAIVLACWMHLHQQLTLEHVERELAEAVSTSERAADRAAAAFAADPAELAGDQPPAVHPGQGTLL